MRVALTGVSHWHTKFFLEPLLDMRDVQVVGVSDPHAVSAIATLAGCPGFSSDTELYETARPDFVFAFGRHCDMVAGARSWAAAACSISDCISSICSARWSRRSRSW